MYDSRHAVMITSPQKCGYECRYGDQLVARSSLAVSPGEDLRVMSEDIWKSLREFGMDFAACLQGVWLSY